MPVFCDVCAKPLSANDETIYTESGGSYCEEHRLDTKFALTIAAHAHQVTLAKMPKGDYVLIIIAGPYGDFRAAAEVLMSDLADTIHILGDKS